MRRIITVAERPQTLGEEIANGVSHGAGALAILAVFPLLVIAATKNGAAAIVGASVFGATALAVYLTSTLYHALAPSRAKRILRVLDHCAIYLLIAGTYTPFTLGVLRGPWGWTVFGIVWTLALVGILLRVNAGSRRPRAVTALYVAMGWVGIVAAKPLLDAMPGWGLFWLLAGGLAYTGGVAFYAAPRLKYGHFVWHLLVLAGTACHFVAVLNYSA